MVPYGVVDVDALKSNDVVATDGLQPNSVVFADAMEYDGTMADDG